MTASDHPVSRRRVLLTGAGLAAGTAAAVSAPFAFGPSAEAQQRTFANPVIWQDFADVEVIRVGEDFYMTASTMHYSPGAPVLRSRDLVNWEFIGHSVPSLDFGAKYDLDGARGYVRGIWASSIAYRASERRYYWLGQIDFARSYLYTATDPAGPWTRHAELSRVYYDAGMLVDDDGTIYVAYGNTEISVAELASDGRSEVRNQAVFTTPSDIGTLEGARFYKIDGGYYLFLTRPANGQYILRSSSPWGPYELRQVLLDMPGPIPGGGVPHQGGLVSTPGGDWYYMAFVDAYPGGRMPALAPIDWTSDGWPQVRTVDGAWGRSYPFPDLAPHPVDPMTGTDEFTAAALAPQWEWNHNPDDAKWSTGNGLRLQTATVTDDLYDARNTLTRRIQGPSSTATVAIDPAEMRDGDRAGLAMLRDSSAWIGLRRDDGVTRISMTDGLTMDADWNTTGTGTERAQAELCGERVWLRVTADIGPGAGRQAVFSYSTDGSDFAPLGPAFILNDSWTFFMGYRFAVFNHATRSLGGAVTVERFTIAA